MTNTYNDPILIVDTYWPTTDNRIPRKGIGLAVEGRRWESLAIGDLKSLIGDIFESAPNQTFQASISLRRDLEHKLVCDFTLNSTDLYLISFDAINRILLDKYLDDLSSEDDKEHLIYFHHKGWFWRED